MVTKWGELMRKRDRYLLTAIVSIWVFTIAAFLLSYYDHVVPDSLIVAWFSAWTLELALVAGIKIKGKEE